ncbi:MAG: acyl-CoA dehydrogenase family protein, partial [Flavobacteriales bacterium]
MSADTQLKAITGGEFLIRDTAASDIFIPEEWNEEQLMMKQMCADFVNQEIAPHLDRMDAMEPGFMESLLDKAAELGLLGISVPQEYGGM